MKGVYLWVSRNKRSWFGQWLNNVVQHLFFALENKNNDHKTNGEFWLIQQMSKQNTKTIFDVGANVGKWSVEARKHLTGSVYAFEPMPDVFSKLKENVSDKAEIKIFNFALSDKVGSLSFNYYPNQNLFSSIYAHSMGGESKEVVVKCIDGDSFCNENAIEEIDFLKVDAEGSEHLIFKGFSQMLRMQKIMLIQFEYGILSINSKFLLKDYFELFADFGYILGKIYPNHVDFRPYNWTLENFIGPNYVAIRKSEVQLINSLRTKGGWKLTK